IRFTSMSPEIDTFFCTILGPSTSPAESGPLRVSATTVQASVPEPRAAPSIATSSASQSSPPTASASAAEPAAPAVDKQPLPNRGSDNRSQNITALMSTTKLAEPDKKKGWFRGHRP